jgi:hypothetical protein
VDVVEAGNNSYAILRKRESCYEDGMQIGNLMTETTGFAEAFNLVSMYRLSYPRAYLQLCNK